MLQTLEYYQKELVHLHLFGDFLMYTFSSDDISCFLLIRSLIEKELGIKIVSLDKKHIEDLNKVALSRRQARRVFDNFMVDEPPQLVERSFSMFVRQSQRLYNSEIIRPYDMMIHGVKEYKQIAEKKLMSGIRVASGLIGHAGASAGGTASNNSYIDSCFATTFNTNTASKKPRDSRPDSNAASFGVISSSNTTARSAAGQQSNLQQTFGMSAATQPLKDLHARNLEDAGKPAWNGSGSSSHSASQPRNTHSDVNSWNGHNPANLASFGRQDAEMAHHQVSGRFGKKLGPMEERSEMESARQYESGEFVVPQFGTPMGGHMHPRERGTSRESTDRMAFAPHSSNQDGSPQHFAHTFRPTNQGTNVYTGRPQNTPAQHQAHALKKPMDRSHSPLDDRHSKDSIQSTLSQGSVDKHNYNTVTSVSEQCFSTLKKLLYT